MNFRDFDNLELCEEDLKFILNMLVMLCNDDRTHF